MRLPKPSDLPSTRIQVGISGTEDAYSSNFNATFGARLCGLCMRFNACPRRYEPPEAGDRACIGAYEPAGASGVLARGSAPSNTPAARPGALAGLFESAAVRAADAARFEEDRSVLAMLRTREALESLPAPAAPPPPKQEGR